MAFIDLSKLRGNNNNQKTPVVAPTAPVAHPTNNKVSADDDQGLLRQVPQTLTGSNNNVDPTGVKEIAGPPVVPIEITPLSNNHPLTTNAHSSSSNLPPINNVNTNLSNQPDMKHKKDDTKDQKVELSGSIVGQEAKVEKILETADKKIQEKESLSAIDAMLAKVNNNITTADEKLLTEKASIGSFLDVAEQRGASDIHFSVGYPPTLRVNGSLVSLGGKVFTSEHIKSLFDSIMTKQQKEKLETDLDIDFSYTHTTGTRFRINVYHKKGTLAGAFRLIPSKIRTVAELNLPRILYDMLDIPQGLIILAGPTGSGKSTTIAAMVQEVNMNMSKHIITIEDPIEYIFSNTGKAMINQREVGNDVTDFKRGLREVLREDPDVVLVGEMRDFETIAMTISAAETGHLVFTTLHTNSASQTVDRMIDVFPDAQQSQVRAQLANVLSAVISQRLIPVKSGGRKAVLEIMIATPAIRNAIRESKTYQIDNMIQTNAEVGMVTMEKALVDLIRQGEITMEEAQTYTTKPDELIGLMKVN